MVTENQVFEEARGDIPLWKIAKKLGIHEMTLIRWRRGEMDEEKKRRLMKAVSEIKKEMIQQLRSEEIAQ